MDHRHETAVAARSRPIRIGFLAGCRVYLDMPLRTTKNRVVDEPSVMDYKAGMNGHDLGIENVALACAISKKGIVGQCQALAIMLQMPEWPGSPARRAEGIVTVYSF